LGGGDRHKKNGDVFFIFNLGFHIGEYLVVFVSFRWLLLGAYRDIPPLSLLPSTFLLSMKGDTTHALIL
jgi:hypothetical protein